MLPIPLLVVKLPVALTERVSSLVMPDPFVLPAGWGVKLWSDALEKRAESEFSVDVHDSLGESIANHDTTRFWKKSPV